MSLPVLEPVRRRRRRRRRRFGAAPRAGVALVGVALLALALQQTVFARHGHATHSTTAPPRKTTPARRQPAKREAPSLLHGPTLLTQPLARPLNAKAAILVDYQSGRVLWAQRPHRRLAIASTTKIMTAVLVLERLKLATVVKIRPPVTRVPLVREGLRAGERVPAWKLLYGLLLYSGNDDALALAEAVAGTDRAFVRMMNEKAAELGLRDTRYAGPSGVIDKGNYSTPYDLAALARYALRDGRFRFIVRTRVKRVSWPAPTYAKIYVNKNRMLQLYPGAVGIKTGWTTLSGPCLVAAATRHGRTLIAVVLDSPTEYADAARLFNLGFQTPTA